MKNSCHILLVEDDQDDIDLLQDSLKNSPLSFVMDVLTQGDLVLPWLKACNKLPNVIVMDLNIPKTHGREVLKTLKNTEQLKHIPVIILTTSSSKEDINYCLENGADEFFTKPTTMEGFAKIAGYMLGFAAQNC